MDVLQHSSLSKWGQPQEGSVVERHLFCRVGALENTDGLLRPVGAKIELHGR